MGFLGGLSKTLFGGSDSKSTGSNSAAQGYSSLSPMLQSGFDQLGQGVAQYTNPNDPANVARFTPMAQTAGETQAYNNINQGFAPTPESLSSNLSMLMNPFNDSVIGGINNAANSDFSILKQNMSNTGQFGSNRQQLGANDIELQRQNQIGSLLQNQYNQALGQVFNNIVPQQQQDAMNQLNAGTAQRNLAYQTQQAPIAALQAGTSMISPFTAGGTSQGTNYASSNTQNGIIPGLGGGAGIGAGAAAMSDLRLKEDIKLIGNENGHNIYSFKYKNQDGKYEGVMAQEVQKIDPEAVIEKDGYLAVDYDKINVTFRRIS